MVFEKAVPMSAWYDLRGRGAFDDVVSWVETIADEMSRFVDIATHFVSFRRTNGDNACIKMTRVEDPMTRQRWPRADDGIGRNA